MENLLKGAYDLHIHTSPDIKPRKCSDVDAAKRMMDAGMAGGVLKNHNQDTADRAAFVREMYPSLKIVGSVVLNRAAGGLNPRAVEHCAELDGRFVWFPTLDAMSYKYYQNDGFQMTETYIPVCSLRTGELLPEAQDVLDVAANNRMIVGTGHINAREGLEVVREGCRRGCTVVISHADNPANRYSLEQQVEAVRLGALIEHSCLTVYTKRTPIEQITKEIRAVGCENVLLTSDFGQPDSPFFDEGLAWFGELLLSQGFTENEVHQMFCDNPARLIG